MDIADRCLPSMKISNNCHPSFTQLQFVKILLILWRLLL